MLALPLRNKKGQTFAEFALTFVIAISFIILLMEVTRLGYAWAVLQYSANRTARESRFDGNQQVVRGRFFAIAAQLGVTLQNGDVTVVANPNEVRLQVRARIPLGAIPALFTQWIGDHEGVYTIRFDERITRRVTNLGT